MHCTCRNQFWVFGNKTSKMSKGASEIKCVIVTENPRNKVYIHSLEI
uniref:Uncharacterized protein n=1 Tax=Nelumbo nucifera TaxID=4432 RepID=A0A822YVP9_NELNU|nr:TPA_asm: hypothetical protein HUJ06_006099 [Nelumbo nucifera]